LTTAVVRGEGSQPAGAIGGAVAGAGDVNGDGYADIIVGASNFDNPEVNEGRVFVFMGSAAGPAGAPWTAESNQDSALFGFAVAGAGDVNGDGYDDIVVGAPSWDQGAAARERVARYHGSGAGPPP